jgi:predicted DNA-binding mobile mystery protein A
MRGEFSRLRSKQLDRSLTPVRAAVKHLRRPHRGWIRAIREAAGISGSELARSLGTSRQAASLLEKLEAEDRITLRTLRSAADALGCDLVYALIPKTDKGSGKVSDLAADRTRALAAQAVNAVEHSMALEDQAVGGVKRAIAQEARRLQSTPARK